MEPIFFAVVTIADGALVYLGKSDVLAAAKALVPGTCHGQGPVEAIALRHAREAAQKILRAVTLNTSEAKET